MTVIVPPDLVDPTMAAIEDVSLPPDYDPVTIALLRELADRIQVIPRGSAQEQKALVLHDIIAVWDVVAFDASRWAAERGIRLKNLTIYDIDSHAIREGASNYAVMAHQIVGDWEGTEHQRFQHMAASLPRRDTSYLIGSGPSARSILDVDVSDGITIVCNTVILDNDIMDHVRPQILTFADPIFHFGPSSYAAEFRAEVRRRMALDPSLWAVIPMRYRSLLTSLIPEHEDRVIGIPFEKGISGPTIDLLTRFSVYPSANILTLFMLPLATTLTTRVGLVGFDGREPNDVGFWKHGKTVQLDHQLDAIRRVHPGFFDLDYEDYYHEHVAYLQRSLQQAEARGITPASLASSYMPPLRRRRDVWSHHEVDWNARDVPNSVVSIDPDWDGDFGHYGPWFRAFASELDRHGIGALSLASRAVPEGDDRALPTFSYPTTNPSASPLYAPQFETELDSAVSRLLADDDSEVSLFFYCADIWHLPAIARLANRWQERLRIHVNLMRAHRFVTEQAGRTRPDRSQIRALAGILEITRAAGVTVSVDTEELSTMIDDLCGVRLDVLPMAAAAEPAVRDLEPEGPVVVYCPALSQAAKGAIDFAQATRALVPSFKGRVEFRMRRVRQPGGTSRAVEQEIEAAGADGVTVIEGELTDEEFAELTHQADIIVVPYHSSAFRTRTSAAVVDAIRAGKPVVVADGTWGARIVEEYGAGIPFRSGDIEDLERAIAEAVNRFPSLRTRAIELAPDARERFSMARLVDHVLAPRSTEILDIDLERLADLEAMLLSHVEGTARGLEAAGGEIGRSNAAVAGQRRAIERLTTRNDELQRAVESRDDIRRNLEIRHEKAIAEYEQRLDDAHEELSAARARIERLQAQVDRLGRAVENLEQGFGNRVLRAARRSVRR